MRSRTRLAFVVVSLLLLPARPGLAWGPEAHRLVASIADRLLQREDPVARGKLAALLATDKANRLTKSDIASEATWADVLRDKSPEARDATAAWHATRLNADKPDLASACFGHTALPAGYPASHGPRDNCSVDKVVQFAAELKNPETSAFERIAAVRYLLSLVGDLHDPLLAIDHGDRGGLCLALQLGAKPPVRLASYWQGTLVGEAAGADAAQAGPRLIAAIGTAELGSWPRGEPQEWLRESYEIAKTVTYGFAGEQPAGKHSFPVQHGGEACPSVDLYRVGPDYETKALAAVRTQLAKAGVRLAAMLRDGMK